MEAIKQHLDSAYAALAKIPVSGEAVDLMAFARQEMRTAYKLANEEEKTDG